jgi:hypothetical protein
MSNLAGVRDRILLTTEPFQYWGGVGFGKILGRLSLEPSFEFNAQLLKTIYQRQIARNELVFWVRNIKT